VPRNLRAMSYELNTGNGIQNMTYGIQHMAYGITLSFLLGDSRGGGHVGDLGTGEQGKGNIHEESQTKKANREYPMYYGVWMMPGAGYMIQGVRCRVQGTEDRVWGARYRV
jgi:hypothetical protein